MAYRFVPGTQTRYDPRSYGLVIAVDLGFAGAGNASCGLAILNGASRNRTFGECLDDCEVALAASADRAAALILEAPLWGLFDQSGNPIPRGAFERNPVRYWYVQPASTVGLAAIYFLSELGDRLRDRCDGFRDLAVFEGFVTGERPAENAANAAERTVTGHAGDAKALLHAFMARTPPQQVDQGRTVTVLTLLDLSRDTRPPLVLRP